MGSGLLSAVTDMVLSREVSIVSEMAGIGGWFGMETPPFIHARRRQSAPG